MLLYLLQGMAIGLLFGLPAGAVGAMTVQRTWMYGAKAGLLTGLGSSVADCFYACVGAFGLTVVSDFLLHYQSIIHGAGGCLILIMGIRMLAGKSRQIQLRENQVEIQTDSKKEEQINPGLFLSSFAIGITNPAAILTFLFAFSWLGIRGNLSPIEGSFLAAGVFIGTYLWWGTLTGLILWMKRKMKKIKITSINRIFGVVLSIFGIVILIRNFFGKTA